MKMLMLSLAWLRYRVDGGSVCDTQVPNAVTYLVSNYLDLFTD